MKNNPSTNLSSLWARAGAMFLARPAKSSPDLEKLLIETARHSSENSRLFIMAATWLSRYGNKVSPERLARLIDQDLDRSFNPILGMLLDYTRSLSGSDHFDCVIAKCQPASEPQPLFEIERRNPTLRKLSERRASDISRRWNLWAPVFEPKYDAIRPESWIASENPNFRTTTAAHHN